MSFTQTELKLAQITDEGFFEKLATAVLRDAETKYRALVHTGVNADGKPVKSPADGIAFRTDTAPAHVYIAHHTTTARDDLAKKWLHDPTTVTPRKGRRPTAPAGDVLKAAAIIAAERCKEPHLNATLILTTNQEPDVQTVRDVVAHGVKVNITIDLWSRSRLSHFLDTTPQGQFLRRHYLGTDADLLSRSLLLELSTRSLAMHALRDTPEAWVPRRLDGALRLAALRPVTFLVAPSGFGKSVACQKWLAAHVAASGAGLVLTHDNIAGALTLADALENALRQLCSSLAPGAGAAALSISAPSDPLFLVVEDINRSGQAALLAELIERWAPIADRTSDNIQRPYRLLCPLWPEVLTSLGDRARKTIEALAVFGSSFTPEEGRRAIQRRAATRGLSISDMTADAMSETLGHDPLLIALHDSTERTGSSSVIAAFVEGAIGRTAQRQRDYAAADYRQALRAYAGAVLNRRALNTLWTDVLMWSGITASHRQCLGHLMHDGDLLHLSGSSAEQRVGYRHDRVRDWLLADAADALIVSGTLPAAILEDPFFAEIIGAALARREPDASFLSRVRAENPLALFHALRPLAYATPERRSPIVAAIEAWLSDPATQEPSHQYLRTEALAALAQTEGPEVVKLVGHFRESGWMAWQAKLRNGDVSGGIELCLSIEPGSGAPWRDIQLAHAKHKFGQKLIATVEKVLRQQNLTPPVRVGTLRLAGHLADPTLGDAIAACWAGDSDRLEHLDDYLWAFSECCGSEAERFLSPVCEAWATLPLSKEGEYVSRSRDNLASDHVRWAFQKWVPTSAIPYFVKRADDSDLRWPITYMLSEIDNPIAVQFVVHEMASMERAIEGTGSFSPFSDSLPGHWRRRQEQHGVGMSEASRRPLQALWTDPTADKHLSRAAFRLWAATEKEGDMALLQALPYRPELASNLLQERLRRGDRTAIPLLLDRLKAAKQTWGWWHQARYVWSDQLVDVLDAELERRSQHILPEWQRGADTDNSTSDLIMRMPPEAGEALLVKHWDHLKYVSDFVQAALFLSTPRLQDMVRECVEACPDPKSLLQYFGQHIGLKSKDHPGITRASQIAAFTPYLSYMARHELIDLWRICNGNGWLAARREALDPFLRETGGILYVDEEPTFSDLDKMLDSNRLSWLDRWLEDYAKTGATTDMIVARVEAWFTQRKSLGALKLVHAMLIQIGRRSDLGILDAELETADPLADAIRADAIFAVRRRSLN